LVNAVLGHAPNLAGVGGELRPGIVHRLDRDTSGLIVVAKNERSLWALQDQFRRKSVEKVYLALVDGRPPSTRAVSRPRSSILSRSAWPWWPGKGRQAVTEYRVREVFPEHVWLEARPLTGRTHQIRVHLSFLGCPVAGDRVYGLRKPTLDLSRQMLHAWRLRFKLPGAADERTFEAAIPPDMMLALELARGRAAEVARS
jgi:23S rRNA pseudouridine1911/1915/1917 synthase